MQRKLRRNDVVIVDVMYGRVWRRIDANHVQVIDCGKKVRIYRDSDVVLSNYKGRFDPLWGDKRFIPMTSLRRLKKIASEYNAHFGGYSGWKRGRWTKLERLTALNDRTISEKR